MKTLFAFALLFAPVLAQAQYDACIVRACFDTAEVCTAKIGNPPSRLPILGCANPVASRGDALPQQSQVLLAENFRWEALIPLPKVPLQSVLPVGNKQKMPRLGGSRGARKNPM